MAQGFAGARKNVFTFRKIFIDILQTLGNLFPLPVATLHTHTTMKTKKEIKLKDGTTLPKGLPVTFIEGKPSRCLVHSPLHSSPLQVRIVSAFKSPSVSALEKWNDDGGCKTPTGKWTECDGYGSDGSPSWLMALGII